MNGAIFAYVQRHPDVVEHQVSTVHPLRMRDDFPHYFGNSFPFYLLFVGYTCVRSRKRRQQVGVQGGKKSKLSWFYINLCSEDEWRGGVGLSINISSAGPVTFLTVTSRSALAFSLRVKRSKFWSGQCNSCYLGRRREAVCSLGRGMQSIVWTLTTRNPETENAK